MSASIVATGEGKSTSHKPTMNPNDILAQQQAMLNEYMQNQQHLAVGLWALGLALFLLHCWVIYMFYARLSGIEQEIMKFRIAYEFAHPPESRRRRGPEPESPENPFA
jgi:hypothetical protein